MASSNYFLQHLGKGGYVVNANPGGLDKHKIIKEKNFSTDMDRHSPIYAVPNANITCNETDNNNFSEALLLLIPQTCNATESSSNNQSYYNYMTALATIESRLSAIDEDKKTEVMDELDNEKPVATQRLDEYLKEMDVFSNRVSNSNEIDKINGIISKSLSVDYNYLQPVGNSTHIFSVNKNNGDLEIVATYFLGLVDKLKYSDSDANYDFIPIQWYAFNFKLIEKKSGDVHVKPTKVLKKTIDVRAQGVSGTNMTQNLNNHLKNDNTVYRFKSEHLKNTYSPSSPIKNLFVYLGCLLYALAYTLFADVKNSNSKSKLAEGGDTLQNMNKSENNNDLFSKVSSFFDRVTRKVNILYYGDSQFRDFAPNEKEKLKKDIKLKMQRVI